MRRGDAKDQCRNDAIYKIYKILNITLLLKADFINNT